MIYFDNASTTKMDQSVIDEMVKSFEKSFANPSSLHSLGFDVEKEIRQVRSTLAKELKVKDNTIFFTPSGTIANNAVMQNAMKLNKNGNIIISQIEHASIQKCASEYDYDFRIAPVDRHGFIIKEELLDLVDENTVLVSAIHVNNEIGSINNINELAKLVKEKNPKTLFHSDGVQAFKKIDVKVDDVDFYTISGHKINGPKGIAVLYIKNPTNFRPMYFGGGQEKGLFSATENTYAIIGLGQAIKLENHYENIYRVNQLMRQELSKTQGVKILTSEINSSPYILNVCFDGIGAEILLHYLEMDDIYISTGSACSKGAKSKVLESLGLSEKEIEGCVRISFDRNSSEGEVKEFIDKLKTRLEMIRGILKR